MILPGILIVAAPSLTSGWYMVGAKSGQFVIDPMPFASRQDCEQFARMIPSGNHPGQCVYLPRRDDGTPVMQTPQP